MENFRVQHRFDPVHVLDETFYAARVREVFALAVAMVDQLDLHAVVEEGQFADALGEDVEVELDLAEDFLVGQEMHFGAAILGLADDLHG